MAISKTLESAPLFFRSIWRDMSLNVNERQRSSTNGSELAEITLRCPQTERCVAGQETPFLKPHYRLYRGTLSILGPKERKWVDARLSRLDYYARKVGEMGKRRAEYHLGFAFSLFI